MQPQAKVIAGGVAGAFTVLAVYAFSLAGVTVPAEVASALTTIISFAGAYFTSDS